MGLSYIDAEYNLADLGTKAYSNHYRWSQILKNGMFEIGFIGRKEVKELKMMKEEKLHGQRPSTNTKN